MASNRVRVGLIGCGYITQTRHLPALARIEGARVTALADLDPEALARTGDKFQVARRYETADQLLAEEEVDLVGVCVPAADHVRVAAAALDAGKHVLVEKPLALSLADAEELVRRGERSTVKTMVGFNLRWHRVVQEGREMLLNGVLGDVESICSTFSSPLSGRGDRLTPWRTRRELGGGAILERAIHHFDLWRFLLGDEVSEVFAISRSERGDDRAAVVTARMGSGALASVLTLDGGATTNRLEVYGERGLLEMDCSRSDGLMFSAPLDFRGSARTRLSRARRAAVQLAGNLGEIRHGGAFVATYEAEWRHFIDAVVSDTQPRCSLQDGLRALEIALAAIESAAHGRPVPLTRP